MKSTILFPLIAFLLLSVTSQAQSSLYFYYDANCVQKLDYNRLGVFHDIEFTDYVFSPSPNKKIYFRVKKIAINKTIVAKVPSKPFLCNDQINITDAIIKNINDYKSVAYIVVPIGNQYELYEVNSVATLQNDAQKTTYKTRDLNFAFTPNQNLATSTNLNLNLAADNQIYFVKNSQLNCMNNYEFKTINKKSSASDYNFNWLKGIGFQRIFTAKGEMRLSSINNQPFEDFLSKNCGKATVTNTKDPVVVPNKKKLKMNNKLSPTDSILAVSKKNKMNPVHNVVDNNNPYSNPYSNPVPTTNPPLGIDDSTPMDVTIPPAITRAAINGNYTVQEKDNLYGISQSFGLPINRLMEINNMKNFDLITGQQLKVSDDASVPSIPRNPVIQTDLTTKKQTIYHVVQQGDNLFKISQKYGITLTQLYNFNKLPDSNIDIDQKLIVGTKQL